MSAVMILLLFSTVNCKVTDNTENADSDGGTLVVGCDATYPPFESIKDGSIVGFDIDIIKEIAERMDRDIEIKSIKWDNTYVFPEEMDLDMIISAIPILEEKESLIDFSDPYFTMEYMLIVLSGIDLKTEGDLKGREVGVLNSEKSYLDEEYLLDYRIEGYDEVAAMFDDLRNENINGILISLPIGANIMTSNEGIYSVLKTVKSNKKFGIVLKEGSALKEEINRIIEEIIRDGTYDEIYSKWFDYNI
ncbi:MAG: transporter substrate-binding domain-containing protein [Actinomycetota bacterium]